MPTDPPSPLRRPMPLRDAVERLLDALPDGARLVLGIVGAPGAGKSAASDAVLAAAGQRGVSAVVVPMDGWHLAHAALEQRGLAAVKGAPETFDADGFVTLLRRLRAQSVDGPAVWAPEFRREIEELVAGAIEVRSDHRLVVVEGNYLLVQEEPWRDVAGLLDVVWYLRPDEDTRRARLIARHEAYGRTADAARTHALGSDEANARRGEESRRTSAAHVVDVDPG